MTSDYLWDRTGAPDADVVRLEQVLGVLRFVPAPFDADRPRPAPRDASPLLWPAAERRWWTSRLTVGLAAAAVLIAIAGLWSWRALRPTASLEVTRLAGTPTIGSTPVTDRQALGVGRWLETDDTARASIDVASVGRVEVEPRSRIGLVGTRPGDHRLQLARGKFSAVIWAPPGQVSVGSPTATAVDLGCIYSMTMDEDGTGLVEVAAGWVGFEWHGRESFIPAGAVSRTRPTLGPGTPHYADTSAAFQAALDLIDVQQGTPLDRRAALDLVLTEARAKDVVTLWHLLSRVDEADRDRVFDRLASFVPPPASVTRDAIRAGRRDALDAWWDGLNLGTASWWRMWKQQWRDKSSPR